MIRKSLAATQAATFAINVPHPERAHPPWPNGTGFFVSPDGLFVTARHVVTDSQGEVRDDLEDGWLTKELRGADPERGIYCRAFAVVYDDLATDLAVLRVNFADQKQLRRRRWLEGRSGFPWIPVSRRPLEEGEPVYSFGYPLSTMTPNISADGAIVGGATTLSPRVTSAIVASTIHVSRIVTATGEPPMYVLDKALNYGNSGGPIIAQETGHAHAVCARFQPVPIPQPHLRQAGVPVVIIPSLYGVVSPLNDGAFLGFLHREGAELRDN